MTIKDIIKFKNPFVKEKSVEVDSFDAFQFSRPEIPRIIEKKSIPWVLYGVDNDYPLFLTELLSTSAIHNAIIEGKSKMMAGSGFLLNGAIDKTASEGIYNSLPTESKTKYDDFIKNPNGEPLIKINRKIAKDYQKNGAFALEVVWSLDFTRIATVRYVNTDNLRAGKFENDIVKEYWYSRDWSQHTKAGYKPKRMPVFDPLEPTKENKEASQIIYVKNGNLEYYGEPSYQGAMSWIKIDSQMGLFHLSNIENGFSPSMTINFYKKPASPEKKQEILDNIKKQFAGAKNTGKAMVFFSDGTDLAPKVEPIQVANLDKQFMLLADQAVQQVCSGHRVTSPLLFGISVPGKLGGSSELDVAYRIFDNSVVEPDRNQSEEVWNLLLEVNKVGVTLEIDKFNPLQEDIKAAGNAVATAINSLSPLVANKVLESMTADEIRGLAGLGASIEINPPIV